MNQLRDSKTKINLMKAFAGESQARNRYTFGASQAKGEKLALIYSRPRKSSCKGILQSS